MGVQSNENETKNVHRAGSSTQVKCSQSVVTTKCQTAASGQVKNAEAREKKTTARIGRLFTMTGLAYFVCIHFFVFNSILTSTVYCATLNLRSDESPVVIMSDPSSVGDEDVSRSSRQGVFEVLAATVLPTTTTMRSVTKSNDSMKEEVEPETTTSFGEVQSLMIQSETTTKTLAYFDEEEFLGEYVTGENREH
jgi:hypothetical protein